MRKFEIVNQKELDKNKEFIINDIILPKRLTKSSCGYDIYTPYQVLIPSRKTILIKTGIKACMNEDEYLLIAIRSSMAIKKGLQLTNGVGIIDSDYYSNESNDGHIMISITNTTNDDVIIQKHDRIAQGIFMKYLVVDNDCANDVRVGGIGSTTKTNQ